MPRILSHTPSWLLRPSPGFDLFQSSAPSRSQDIYHAHREKHLTDRYAAPSRLIARRGTEVFIVVDNEIRWSDLCMLKDEWEELQEKAGRLGERSSVTKEEGDGKSKSKNRYKILKCPINGEIQQLSVSPNGIFLAILTSHTIRIALLPDPLHLEQSDSEPIKLRTYTIGPTDHVISQSCIVRALWHPFGVGGTCLVTVTADAIVRLWELDRDNRWSFDRPSLAIDLQKLALGSSEEDNFAPSGMGRSRRFSSDMAGMEVASACFGGTGSSEESAWSAMTLWIAMKDGDVYALCPLLPTKWQPALSTIPSLSIAAASIGAIQASGESSALTEIQRDQYQWISSIEKQEPVVLPGATDLSPWSDVYACSPSPGPVPKLQGPFQVMSSEEGENLEISDIHVIAAKLEADELIFGESFNFDPAALEHEALSASVVCLMTIGGKVYICLDLDGVEGQWLPRKKSSEDQFQEDYVLVSLEVLDTLKLDDADHGNPPTFTPDVFSRYSLFINNCKGVYFLSLHPWLQSFEGELQSTSSTGASFRINVLKNAFGTLRERIINFEKYKQLLSTSHTTACVAFEDSDLGYFLLTCVDGRPQAAILDLPYPKTSELSPLQDSFTIPSSDPLLIPGPPRSPYQPPQSLWVSSSLRRSLETAIPPRLKKAMTTEIRLSPATLEMMTDAHRILSQETHRLGHAAADLFRRCERLQQELKDQIKRIREVAEKTGNVVGNTEHGYQSNGKLVGPDRDIEERLRNAVHRQEQLLERHKRLVKKVSGFPKNELSEKEGLWVKEIKKFADAVIGPKDGQQKDGEEDQEEKEEVEEEEEEEETRERALEPWRRYREIRDLSSDLIARARELLEQNKSNDENTDNNADKNNTHNPPTDDDPYRIPAHIRKAKIGQVKSLLDNETALVDMAISRLEHLSLVAFS